MGQSLIIQGIVSKFHFHVNNSNYSIKHMTLGNWGGGGGGATDQVYGYQ